MTNRIKNTVLGIFTWISGTFLVFLRIFFRWLPVNLVLLLQKQRNQIVIFRNCHVMKVHNILDLVSVMAQLMRCWLREGTETTNGPESESLPFLYCTFFSIYLTLSSTRMICEKKCKILHPVLYQRQQFKVAFGKMFWNLIGILERLWFFFLSVLTEDK